MRYSILQRFTIWVRDYSRKRGLIYENLEYADLTREGIVSDGMSIKASSETSSCCDIENLSKANSNLDVNRHHISFFAPGHP